MVDSSPKMTAISRGYKFRLTDLSGQETVMGPFDTEDQAQSEGEAFATREYPLGGVASIRTFPACTHLAHKPEIHRGFCPSCGDPVS